MMKTVVLPDRTLLVLLKSEHQMQIEVMLATSRESQTRIIIRYMSWWHARNSLRRYWKALQQVSSTPISGKT